MMPQPVAGIGQAFGKGHAHPRAKGGRGTRVINEPELGSHFITDTAALRGYRPARDHAHGRHHLSSSPASPKAEGSNFVIPV